MRQLGDILLTTPCINAVKRERPNAKLTVLTHAMGRLILDNAPAVDEHFFYDDSWRLPQHIRLGKALRERKFDLVIDFMNNPRSALLTGFSGGKERLAFQSARSLAYTTTIPRPGPGRYIVQDKFELLRAAGMSPHDESLTLPWFETHTQPFMRLYAGNPNFRAAPLRVVFSPTHRRDVRQWPIDRYARLADRLTREWSASCLFLWGPGEEAVADACLALCKEPVLKAPKTSFRELAALIANADLFIGNSNGPSHVAVAGGICSLQIHGPTSAIAWCPNTPQHRFVQSPSFGTGDGAIGEVTEEMVWATVLAMEAVVKGFAEEARLRGPRLSWRSMS